MHSTFYGVQTIAGVLHASNDAQRKGHAEMQTITLAVNGSNRVFHLSERTTDGQYRYFGPGGSLLSRAQLTLRITQPEGQKAAVVQANLYLPTTTVVDGEEKIVGSESCFMKFTISGSSTPARRDELADYATALAAHSAIIYPVNYLSHAPDA